jgi:hypothetical protein
MWDEIQDMSGEIFDIEPALEQIKQERLAREEDEEFLDICNDLMMEGLIDEDAIEATAHKIMDEQGK